LACFSPFFFFKGSTGNLQLITIVQTQGLCDGLLISGVIGPLPICAAIARLRDTVIKAGRQTGSFDRPSTRAAW
jgi:hypothetical protein